MSPAAAPALAQAAPAWVALEEHGTLPDGVAFVTVRYDGTWEGYEAAPAALVAPGGRLVGKSSHNSDTRRITYRSDRALGRVIL